jgi:hypothetical protein
LQKIEQQNWKKAWQSYGNFAEIDEEQQSMIW